MTKYTGTSVSSKNKKNKMRSSATKLPMQPASSSNSHATWLGARSFTLPPRRARGNSTAAMSTRNSEMPSIPRCHDTPSDGAQP
jgi:hypothetical protein